jgi:uncharacterized protein involved in type VI secretion and phage assembly
MTEPAFVSTRPFFKVDGQARDDLQGPLTAMVVHLPLNGCAHAELHLTNWGLNQGAEAPDFLFNAIALGSAVEILMNGPSSALTLFKGEITAIEENYGQGAPSLVLLLQDPLHRLARLRHSRAFEEQSPDAVVNSVAADAGLPADVSVSSAVGTWHQINESDQAFVMRLLDRFNLCLRMDNDRLRARPEEPDPAPVALSAQDSVLSARLIADLNHQAVSTAVHGYNFAADTAAEEQTDGLQPAPSGTTAKDELTRLRWPGEEIVPQPFARTSDEARGLSQAHFRGLAKRFVHGEITCQGEAALRSGRQIELSGVSPRLRGLYQVVHCVHRFDNVTGFETHLKVHRPDWRS